VVKRKDFNATLKQLTDCLERMCSGNRFHSDGAAKANEQAPNFVAVLGMTRSSRAADRSLCQLSKSLDNYGFMTAKTFVITNSTYSLIDGVEFVIYTIAPDLLPFSETVVRNTRNEVITRDVGSEDNVFSLSSHEGRI